MKPKLERTAVTKRCTRSQTRVRLPATSECSLPEEEEGHTSRIGESDEIVEWGGKGDNTGGIEGVAGGKVAQAGERVDNEGKKEARKRMVAEKGEKAKRQPYVQAEKSAAVEKIQWLPAPPSHTPFQGQFPPHKAQAIGPAAGCIDPYTLFSLFFSHEQVSLLAKHTNMYAASHGAGLASISHPFIRKWYPTSPAELLVLFAILIYMGVTIDSPGPWWQRGTTHIDATLRHLSSHLVHVIQFGRPYL